jgi:hypothetical protein
MPERIIESTEAIVLRARLLEHGIDVGTRGLLPSIEWRHRQRHCVNVHGDDEELARRLRRSPIAAEDVVVHRWWDDDGQHGPLVELQPELWIARWGAPHEIVVSLDGRWVVEVDSRHACYVYANFDLGADILQ